MGKKVTLKKELGDVQSLVNQLQAQAGEGEIDASLIDQIASAVNVAVDQAGNATETVEDAVAASGVEPKPAPAPVPAPTDEGEKPDEELGKSAPASSRAPSPTIIMGDDDDDIRAKLPEFMKALESGRLKKAQQIMDNDQADFDRAFHAACRAILDENGVNARNMRKLHSAAPDIDPADQDALRKSLTSASGFSGVYLHRLAKLMMPVYAGLRRRFPANAPSVGSSEAMWRIQLGFRNLSFANLMSVGEAAIGEEVSETAVEFSAPYSDLSLNDRVTLKATAAARGYDDPMQVAVIRIMTAMLQAEERKLLGDNHVAIAAPGKPTCVSAGSGTVGSATSKFYITALTYRGALAGSVGGTSAVGETEASPASDAIDLSAKASVTITWTAVPGAVAYNVYYNPSSTTKYYATTVYRNSATLTAVPGSGEAPPATTTAANANGYEGLISWAELSTVYAQSIYNKITPTSLNNAAMTATNSGISEIDTVLENLWNTWQVAPSLIVTTPAIVGKITNLLMSINSGGTYRIEVSQERGTMRGGAFVSGYVNKYAPYADGTPRYIDIIPHPYMTAGKLLILSETIPYAMSREARGFGIETLVPYTYFPLAASTISYPFAVTCSEVLECYHPAAQTAITNIAA